MAKKKKKVKKRKPRANGADGRNSKGQFAKGNSLSVGNKSHTNEKAKALKETLIESITKKDIKAIGKKLITKAKSGDVHAAREIFDRLWGRAKQEQEVLLSANEDLKSFISWLVGRDGSKD